MSAHVNAPSAVVWERYIAIDLHKHYLMVGGINAQQQVVLTPRKITLDRWRRRPLPLKTAEALASFVQDQV